jgi:hypothetical protein
MKLSRIRSRYLREAALAILTAEIAINILPPHQLFALASRRTQRVRRFAIDEIDWVAWAIIRIAENPWAKPCDLACALAAKSMLRRRGISSRVCLGIAHQGESLVPRTWLECDQKIVFGRVDVPQAVLITQFGDLAQ